MECQFKASLKLQYNSAKRSIDIDTVTVHQGQFIPAIVSVAENRTGVPQVITRVVGRLSSQQAALYQQAICMAVEICYHASRLGSVEKAWIQFYHREVGLNAVPAATIH